MPTVCCRTAKGLEIEMGHRSSYPFPWMQTILLSLLFFLVSAAIPVAEAVIPPRYPEGWLEHTTAEPKISKELHRMGIPQSLSDFASQNGMDLLYGRALYPRYYGPKHGILGNAWFAFIPRDYARLGFYLVGFGAQNVVLPLEDKPTNFPHASDVIVLGCFKDEFLEAQLVVLAGDQITIFKRVPQPNWTCSEGE